MCSEIFQSNLASLEKEEDPHRRAKVLKGRLGLYNMPGALQPVSATESSMDNGKAQPLVSMVITLTSGDLCVFTGPGNYLL